MKNDPAPTDRTAAFRIVAIYALIASLWIYLSDNFVALFSRDPAILLRISVVKGFLFITVTSTILYQLIARHFRKSRRLEEDLQSTVDLLRICNESGNPRELMRNLTHYFQQLTGCDAIGIRLRDGEDYPYYEYRGFSEEFVLAENSLCAYDQAGDVLRDNAGHPAYDCMCGNIIAGRFDPTLPFFTARGSFWSSCTTDLLASTTDAERQAKTRNRCNKDGYESVALIPLRLGGETFGLFQFNDRRRGRFSADRICRLEDLVAYVAIALAKLRGDEALMESSRFSRQIISNAEVGVIVYGRDLRYQVWNPYMERVTGLKADAILGRDPLEVFPFMGETGVYGMLRDTLAGLESPPVDVPDHSPYNGRTGWLSICNAPLKNTRDEVIGVIATVRDITDRTRARKELEDATYRLQLATASGHLGIWDRDMINDVLVWDDRMYEIYGIVREDFPGCFDAWRGFLHPDDAETALEANRAAVAGEREYDVEFRIVRPDGTVKHVRANGVVIRDGNGKAVRMIGLNQDITERVQIEEQLRQSQKMEAIGQLAGGVAHDFNNILTVICGYCHMLRDGMDPDSPYRLMLDQVLAAEERAAGLTRSLLAFSRKQSMNQKPVNLNEVILNVGKLLSRIIGEDIRMHTVLGANPATVCADSGQMEQVLMNLAANARDAMPAGGKLTIETENARMDEGVVHAHGLGPPGDYVVMSLSDSGTGMAAETTKKIFEPFFTTKEVGKGTGLGLAIVYGVIKQHNGYIDVRSEQGVGTTFRVYLPICRDDRGSDGVEEVGGSPPVGSETILVVEDDEAIRQLTGSLLASFGYKIIFAENGEQAVEKFSANSEAIDMVVMDMIMPGKSGLEAFAEISALKPEVKVMLMSGYSPDFLRNRGMSGFNGEVLAKPFQPLEFVRKIRSVLDS